MRHLMQQRHLRHGHADCILRGNLYGKPDPIVESLPPASIYVGDADYGARRQLAAKVDAVIGLIPPP
jgi:hypothetical protein